MKERNRQLLYTGIVLLVLAVVLMLYVGGCSKPIKDPIVKITGGKDSTQITVICPPGEICKQTGTAGTFLNISPTATLTDEEKIDLLRKRVHEMDLQFKVWCVYWSSEDSFQAIAWHKGYEDIDQTADRWIVDRPTQAEAAYQLYLYLGGPPTHPGRTLESIIEKKEKQKHKFCPPELSGQ
jgi:hypothetical protein